jgi:large conductance mechanosensitive channel
MLKGFRDFIMRGNIVDLAVAVTIGVAFTAVVAAFTSAIIKPILAAFGGANVNGLGFSLRHTAGVPAGSAADVLGKSTFVDISGVLNAAITFLITALVVYFVIVVPMNKINERRAAKVAAGEAEEVSKTDDVVLLEQIRDILQSQAR